MSTISLEPAVGGRPSSNRSSIWGSRELLRMLVERNLKIKYQRSALGFLWTLLQPALTIAVLYLIFSYILGVSRGMQNYWAFLISGFFAFSFFSATTGHAANVIRSHAGFARNAPFPSEIPLLGAVLSRLVEFGLELCIALLLIVAFHHHGVPASFLLLPLLLVILLLLTVGVAFPIATLSVYYADVEHALPVLLRMLFYLSGVFYPATMVPETIQSVFFLNPVAGVITLFHDVLYAGQFPSGRLLVGTAASAALIFAAGYATFHRHRSVFVDIA